MDAIASQITSLTIVYSIVYSDADQRKHQSSASLAFVCGIHRGPVNSPHKEPVTRKMFPFDDAIMILSPKNSEKTPHSPPVTVMCGVSFCGFIVGTRFKLSAFRIVIHIVLYPTAIYQEHLASINSTGAQWQTANLMP